MRSGSDRPPRLDACRSPGSSARTAGRGCRVPSPGSMAWSLRSSPTPRHLAVFAVTTTLVFAAYTAQLWLVAWSVGITLDPVAAWGALGLATIAGVLSLLPFGLGATDLVLAAMLTSLGVPPPAAGAIAFGYRLVSTLPLGLLGTVSYAWLSARLPAGGARRRHRRRPRRPGRRQAAGSAVTAAGLLAAAAVLLAIGGSVALVLPAVRRTRLGIVHPAIVWLALHAVFFGSRGGDPGGQRDHRRRAGLVCGRRCARDRLGRARLRPHRPSQGCRGDRARDSCRRRSA